MTRLMDELYDRLPDVYRAEDGKIGEPLRKFIATVVDQAGDVDAMYDRLNYEGPEDGIVGDTSDLVNPNTADGEWLPWIAQLLGVYLPPALDEGQRRELLNNPAASYLPGTKAAIIAAAQSVLVDSKFAQVFTQTQNSGAIGQGSQWDLLLVTKDSETLDNMVPEVQATTATTRRFASVVGATPNIIEQHVDSRLYKSRALKVTAAASGNLAFNMINALISDRVPVFAADPYVAMTTVFSKIGTPSRSGAMTIRFYDASNNSLATLSQAITVTNQPQSFSVLGSAPANASTALIQITISGVLTNEQYYFAQLGMRRGTNTTWVPRPADPAAAVIAAGAKPAGVVLHVNASSTSWTNLEATRPTWAQWENSNWQAIEETGLA